MSFWTGTHWEPDAPAPSPTPARPGKRRHVLEAITEGALIALLTVGLIAGTTFAGRGGSSLHATISIGDGARLSAVSGEVTFSVTRSIPDNDPVMWVTTKCYDSSGTRVSWLDLPVIWGTWDSLEGYAGAYDVGGSWCEAYATLRPWQSRVLGDAYLRFDVAG
ncbi:MAG: hypothetical protein A2V85_11110 [Chloroflexi bacterium RBG_16_72_14]|nr:MAG: hypothetical protein A2V85_11110 [Chloroflexi bacterium RBG_16_72_14]